MTKHSTYKDELESCLEMLKELQGWPHYAIFGKPVDIIALNIPDYPTIIKKPMDLGTVKTRLEQNDYCHAFEFWSDLELVWKNALLYNTEGEIRAWALELQKRCEERFASITKVSEKEDIAKCTRETRHQLMSVLKGLNRPQFKQCFEIVSKKCFSALDYNKTNDNAVTLYVHRIPDETAKELINRFEATETENQPMET